MPDARIAEVSRFLTGFVLPLVQGGDLHVGHPLTLDDLDAYEHAMAHASVAQVAVDDARAAVLRPLVSRPPPLILDRTELALAFALHNALFLAHPAVEQWLVTDTQLRRVADVSAMLASQVLARDRPTALGRHGLLHNVFAIARRDLTVTWWTGSSHFRGQAAPTRLTVWKSWRRVVEDVAHADFAALLASPTAAPITAALLRRSPLTQLLTMHPAAPLVHWEDVVWVLRDAELARALVYRLLGDTPQAAEVAQLVRLAAAFEQMIERTPDPADVRAVLAFFVYALSLWTWLAPADAHRREDWVSIAAGLEAAGPGGSRPRGLPALLALPAAAAKLDPRLAEVPGIGADPAIAQRWLATVAAGATAAGPATVDAIAARLARHIGQMG